MHTAYKPPLEPTANSMGSEVADLMEFDASTKASFLATIERYNELAASGKDLDHDKAACAPPTASAVATA